MEEQTSSNGDIKRTAWWMWILPTRNTISKNQARFQWMEDMVLIFITEFNECSVVTVSNSSKKRISFRKQQRFLCCDEFDLSHNRSQIWERYSSKNVPFFVLAFISRLNSSHSIDAAILYMRKKVFYSIHILYHTHILNRLIESCTIQGIDLTDELTRGSQYKIENILLRINNSKEYSMLCLNATESQVSLLFLFLNCSSLISLPLRAFHWWWNRIPTYTMILWSWWTSNRCIPALWSLTTFASRPV